MNRLFWFSVGVAVGVAAHHALKHAALQELEKRRQKDARHRDFIKRSNAERDEWLASMPTKEKLARATRFATSSAQSQADFEAWRKRNGKSNVDQSK